VSGLPFLGEILRWSLPASVAIMALVIAGAVVPTGAAYAGAVPPFTECPAVNFAPSCSIQLQVNADNSVTVAVDPAVGAYDGADDTLIGITNSSPLPVSAVTVTGPGSGLSGFDSDGLCAYLGCQNGATGYEGPGTSLVTSPTAPDSAEVDFTPALAPGATAYFSLEGALQYAQLTARKGTLTGGGDPGGSPKLQNHTLIYVHGINENAGKAGTQPDFPSVFNNIPNVTYSGFIYYEDAGQVDPRLGLGSCGSGLPINVLDKAASVGMPIISSDATGTPTCDGSSDIGINAIKLEEQINAEYMSSGRPVILVGYSMGASIIRGMIAYSQARRDQIADTMIDSVSFIHGVQQGSYLANGGQFAAGSPPFGKAFTDVSRLFNLPLDRPASQELQDGSAWFTWVNSHSTKLPPIPYFNTYGDIHVSSRVCVIPDLFGCLDVGDAAVGDIVILPGTDNPTDTPILGGQKFLNGPRGVQNWEFRQLHRYYFDPLFPPSEAIAWGEALVSAPEQHRNIMQGMGQTTVRDCQTGQAVAADDELIRILNGRAIGINYNCVP
jgi:hypothetical protein